MELKYLNIRQVTALTGVSRATIYRLMAQNELPPSYKLSKGRVGWKNTDILEWLKTRQVSKTGNPA